MAERLAIPDSVVFEVLEGQAVLLNLQGGNYFSLNGTGTRIWQLIEEHGERDAVCDAMGAEFDVGRPVIERDVDRMIGELRVRGLLETNSDAPHR